MFKEKNLALYSLILAIFLSLITTKTIGHELTQYSDTNQNNSICENGSYNIGTLNFCFSSDTKPQNKFKVSARKICEPLWQIVDKYGNCVPKYNFEVCGATDFPCSGDGQLADLFRLTERSLNCSGGGIVVMQLPTTESPEPIWKIIDVYACSPITQFPR